MGKTLQGTEKYTSGVCIDMKATKVKIKGESFHSLGVKSY